MSLFQNCLIQAPDGTNLSRCGLKKLKWYLKNDLAEQICDNPPVIRLKFEPKDRRNSSELFILAEKPNHCVVCGTKDNLTRHHIVPHCFIKHMNIKVKVDVMWDILALCRDCHDVYERHSTVRKQKMAESLGVPLNGMASEKMVGTIKAVKAAHAIYHHFDKIPEPRKTEMFKTICSYLNTDQPTRDQILDLSRLDLRNHEGNVSFSKYFSKIPCDYNQFAKGWREHFMDCMKPKFMPSSWSADRVLDENMWIPSHLLNRHKSC